MFAEGFCQRNSWPCGQDRSAGRLGERHEWQTASTYRRFRKVRGVCDSGQKPPAPAKDTRSSLCRSGAARQIESLGGRGSLRARVTSPSSELPTRTRLCSFPSCCYCPVTSTILKRAFVSHHPSVSFGSPESFGASGAVS